MKELSIEEKAKAYDEAIERVKNYYSTTDSSADIKLIGLMFPELREESEDERIRKGIIRNLEYLMDRAEGFVKDELKERIAWLEKQGEHANFRNKIQIGDKVTRNEDGVLVNLSQLKRVAKKDEKQDEQKSYASETMNEKWDFDSGFTRMMEKEQKHAAWSEEDEINLGEAIWYVENPAPMVAKDSMLVEWLKNLRGRVQSQHNQEWSEEDEKYTKDLVDYFTGGLSLKHTEEDIANWLKSLKDRYTWKPSDEQMKALKHASNDCSIAFADMKILATLYEQLKALHRYEQNT